MPGPGLLDQFLDLSLGLHRIGQPEEDVATILIGQGFEREGLARRQTGAIGRELLALRGRAILPTLAGAIFGGTLLGGGGQKAEATEQGQAQDAHISPLPGTRRP